MFQLFCSRDRTGSKTIQVAEVKQCTLDYLPKQPIDMNKLNQLAKLANINFQTQNVIKNGYSMLNM